VVRDDEGGDGWFPLAPADHDHVDDANRGYVRGHAPALHGRVRGRDPT